jgi:hypothetical protein
LCALKNVLVDFGADNQRHLPRERMISSLISGQVLAAPGLPL